MLVWVIRTALSAVLASVCFAVEECPATVDECLYQNVAMLKSARVGPTDHYYIGGMFGVHEQGYDAYTCSSAIRKRGIVNLEAFLWSIKKFTALYQTPGIDVGGVAFDSCSRKEQTIENVLSFAHCNLRPMGVDRRHLLAYVGPDRSSEALAISDVMADLNITYISHAATSAELSDSTKHPFFLRTVPSDTHDAIIMANMLGVAGAEYVILLYLDNDYGRAGSMKFREEISNKKDTCIGKSMAVTPSPSDVEVIQIEQMLERYQDMRYVALFMDAAHASRILEAVNRKPSIANKFIFIGTSSWGRSLDISGLTPTVTNSIIMSHVVSDPLYTGYMNEFKTHWTGLRPDALTDGVVNPWLMEYFQQENNCRFDLSGASKCNTTINKFKGDDIDVYVPYTMMAVEAIIKGVKAAAEEKCSGNNLCSDLLNLENQGTVIYEKIKETGMNVFNVTRGADGKYISGDVSLANSAYNIYTITGTGGFDLVYNYKPSQTENIFERMKIMDNNIYTKGSCSDSLCPVCKSETTMAPTTPAVTTPRPADTTTDPTFGGTRAMVYYPIRQEITGAFATQPRTQNEYMTRFEIGQKWIIPIGVLAGLGIFAVIIFEIYVMYKLLGTRQSHKWRTVWLGQLLLFGIFLSYLTLFAYLPIPTKATCGITRFGVGISYAIMFSVLLVKLMVILTSKSSESLLPGDIESPNYLKGIYQFLMFMFAVGVQVVIGIQWLITVPPEAIQVFDNRGEPYWICNHYTWAAGSGWENMAFFINDYGCLYLQLL
ncbi:metabotropic glutamate receptor [Patella vulgata]|uniref:metabotropic glutamate receptor n=1 Tax=Patella vulgata TaxID=6465 RepID=UPI0024AA02BF|nr:metabotropic glutamate receptor [Patella vulgata]